MKAIVVGGGALGCSAALALAADGHSVEIHERDALGSGATGKAAGILSSFAWNDADYRLIAETRGALGEAIALAMAAGDRHARGAWRSSASIVVGGAAQLRLLDELQSRVERHTEECERLGAREAAAQFPGVEFAPGEEVLVAQEDGVIEAGDFLSALRTRLAQEGVTVRERSAVAQWPRPASHALQSANRAGALGPDADIVVVAGGAWTGHLLQEWGVCLPLLAYRTQLAALAIAEGGTLPIVHDLTQRFYTRPEAEGTMLAGDGTQLRPFDPDAYSETGDPEFLESLAERVSRRFRAGGAAQVRASWAGLCVGTPDRRPLCGAVAGHPGLFVLTGDNGFGLMRSLALGQRLADAVRGVAHPDLDPMRFGAQPPTQFDLREGYGPA